MAENSDAKTEDQDAKPEDGDAKPEDLESKSEDINSDEVGAKIEDIEKPKYLFPASYKYYLIGQYVLLGISIAIFGDFILALIFELVNVFQTEESFNFSARLSSDLGLSALFLAGMYFTHRHKEKIKEMISNWSPLVFQEPVWVRTGVRDSGGQILDCKFEAEVTLWFSDADSASAASKFQNKIRSALKLFLEEVSQDPVLRRSKNYLNDWINDSFQMQDLQKIDIRSIKFYPAPRGEDE